MASISTLKRNANKNLSLLADELTRKALGYKAQCSIEKLNEKVILICFEKYYLKNNAVIALNVLLIQEEEYQEASVICFAGGHGILNNSYNCEEVFAEEIKNHLIDLGFTEI